VLDALAVHASSEYRDIFESLNAAPAATGAYGCSPVDRSSA
jgi:hypothetical protein